MSIFQQAEMISALAQRCKNVDGTMPKETFACLSKQDAIDLSDLARRLFLIAPYEREIKKLVTGR